MNTLFSITAPLMIRLPQGKRHIIAKIFPHKEGVLYFDPFWNQRDIRESVHLIKGDLSGSGPWKIAEHVIQVLPCQGSEPELARQFYEWRDYLGMADNGYPSEDEIIYLAKKLGAQV